MLIECLIGGDGPNSVTIGSFIYLFRANEHGHKVCPVNSREARERLLSLPDFKEYEPPQDTLTAAPARKRKRNANRATVA